MGEARPFDEFRVIEPQVRRLLGRAGVETDEPDQVVRGMLVLTAVAIVRLAHANDYDINDALRVAGVAAGQLRRLVMQIGSQSPMQS